MLTRPAVSRPRPCYQDRRCNQIWIKCNWAKYIRPNLFYYSAAYQYDVLHTHTHPFNGPFSGTTRVSRYQKGKTNLDFTEARDSEWQWHQLGHMQVCTSLQTDNHASIPPLSFFTGRMPFRSPNQQCQSTEGKRRRIAHTENKCFRQRVRLPNSVRFL